jgi:type I restriction enzyme S subunit
MTATPKPYPAYKNSGSQWLGAVPRTWELHRLRSLTSSHTERNQPELPLLSVAREKGVFVRSLTGDDDNHNIIPEDLTNYKVARAGSLVINKMKAWQGSMGIAPCDGVVSPAYYVFDFHIANPPFGEALLRSRPYVAHFGQASDGVRIGQWDLNIARMHEIPVALPPANEQVLIVRYLNYMDRRIRHTIRAKQKLIKLLDEQKQAIIQRAVIRGLDSNVRLKPSGLKWVGEVPESWEVNRAKWFYHEVDERSRKGEEELLSVSHITGVTPRAEKNITMFMAESYLGHKLCRQGDLVINTMWAWMGALGVSHQTGIVSPAYAVYRPVRPDMFAPEFIEMLLRSNGYIGEFVCRSTGIQSSRLRLYPEEFFRVPLVRPPIDEQHAIVASIREHTTELDRAKDTAQRGVAFLGEYRDRLLADVVTGKLDVREAAASLPDEIGQEELFLDEMKPFGEDGLEDYGSGLDASLEEVEA